MVLVAASVGAWWRWVGRKNLALVAIWGVGVWGGAMYAIGH